MRVGDSVCVCVWWGGFDTCGKPENAEQILTKSERLDPQLPAISARVVLNSCKKPERREEKTETGSFECVIIT